MLLHCMKQMVVTPDADWFSGPLGSPLTLNGAVIVLSVSGVTLRRTAAMSFGATFQVGKESPASVCRAGGGVQPQRGDHDELLLSKCRSKISEPRLLWRSLLINPTRLFDFQEEKAKVSKVDPPEQQPVGSPAHTFASTPAGQTSVLTCESFLLGSGRSGTVGGVREQTPERAGAQSGECVKVGGAAVSPTGRRAVASKHGSPETLLPLFHTDRPAEPSARRRLLAVSSPSPRRLLTFIFPQMMEASEEPDRSSPGSNAVVKEMLGGLRASMRSSFRRVAEKSPLSPTSKGSKVTPKGDESGPPLPPSPSPSWSSSLTSPLKNVGEFFIKKEEDDGELTPQTRKGLTHSKTDPNLGSIGDTLMKKVASGLRFSSKKDKNKGTKQELVPVVEGPVEKKTKESEDEEEEKVPEEVEEAYVLPDIPHTPLSVMQISKLIETEVLEEAHLNLLALRREFQQEQRCCGEDSPMELAKKEKDLSLLYGDLRNKIKAIVRDSNSLPSRNKGLLVHVARIIQEEERRAEEPGGPPGSWMDFWREAVAEGVQAKVGGVSLMQKEQNASWLAVHLGLLGKAIVEDLESVRKELRWFYPPSFKVFHTYVNGYHRAVGQHLRTLEQPTTELKDLFALLDWIINQYQSERIMGSTSLQPDMNGESKELQLEDGLLEQLQDKYCCRVKEEMRSSLDRIIELQDEELWGDGKVPEVEDDFLSSEIDMDIWTLVKGKIQSTGQIDAQLKMKVVRSCMEELKPFPKRFEARMQQCCSELRPQQPWTQYHITYINSFIALQQHVDECRDVDACPDQVSGFKEEVKWLIEKLLQELEDQFKEDVKPYLRRMMTSKWMSNDEDFAKLHSRIDSLAEHCSLMRPAPAQEFASRLHYHVVREYIGQLMKSNYSCKSRKHEKAAAKIRHQWEDLRALFKDMRSTHEWLHDVGEDLSDIIGQKNKRDIKTHLQPVVEHYPDFSRKHLVAVLYFRGLVRGREYQLILQKLTELKKQRGSSNTRRVLFATIPATVNTDCLSNLPFSCLRLLS